jgi:hypothetical protein
MEIIFEMPGDQDFDQGLWERLGVGQEWERLGKAFYNAGCQVDDTEDVVLSFEPKDEARVRKIVADARSGAYGQDAQAYWSAATEVGSEEE